MSARQSGGKKTYIIGKWKPMIFVNIVCFEQRRNFKAQSVRIHSDASLRPELKPEPVPDSKPEPEPKPVPEVLILKP